MGGTVGKIFGIDKPKPDLTSFFALKRQEKLAAEEKKRLQIEQNARLRARVGRNFGFRSLLSGLETGTRQQLG